MDKSQRQYFLREQLKAIQKELGEADGRGVEVEDLRKKLYDAKMPPKWRKKRLKSWASRAHSRGGAGILAVADLFDWLVELPWNVFTEEQIDLPKARAILDADHHGLEKVKKRIINFSLFVNSCRMERARSLLGRTAGRRQNLPGSKHCSSDES